METSRAFAKLQHRRIPQVDRGPVYAPRVNLLGSEGGSALDYRRLHDHPERGRLVRDYGGAREPLCRAHGLAARTKREEPANRGRADGQLDTESHRHWRSLHRLGGTEHGRLLRQEGVSLIAVSLSVC